MSKILFAELERTHVLKFVGDIRVNVAPTISAFLERVGNEDEEAIVIDLKACTCIDSTCLGVLAKIALASAEILGTQPTLVSTNPDITRVIDSMGFEQIFLIVRDDTPTCSECIELPTRVMNEEQLKEQVLDAHRTLMKLNKDNEASFRDLVAALEAEDDTSNASNPRVSAKG
jgi:anti-anti-sigma factor